MKKIFFLFIILIVSTCIVQAKDINENYTEYYIKIDGELDFIREELYTKNNLSENLDEICIYVYDFANYMKRENTYDDSILKIIIFTDKAIEEHEPKYIDQCEFILNNIFYTKNIILKINYE
jgi:hypothetical protein